MLTRVTAPPPPSSALVREDQHLVLAVQLLHPHVHPLVANVLSYVAGFAASYTVHSRWSFGADRRGEEGTTLLRFVVASGIAFTLNSFWVWLTTIALHLSPLAPVPAMMFVTPLISFVLNRWWVFRAA